MQKSQTLIDIFNFVESHPSAIQLSKFLTGKDLEKLHQVVPVRQIDEQIVDLQKLDFEMNWKTISWS